MVILPLLEQLMDVMELQLFLARPLTLTSVSAIGGNVMRYDLPSVGGLNWIAGAMMLKDSLLLASLLVFVVAVTAIAMILVA